MLGLKSAPFLFGEPILNQVQPRPISSVRRGRFPIRHQLHAMDCGPTCLQMVLEHFGRRYSLADLRELCYLSKTGVSLLGIATAAETLGLHTLSAKLTIADLSSSTPLPFVAHWQQRHFVVVYKIGAHFIDVADPAQGRIRFRRQDFIKGWSPDGKSGVAMFFEPTEKFYAQPNPETPEHPAKSLLLNYLTRHRALLFQLFLGLLISSAIGLAQPFLTQALIDQGIQALDLGFVHLVLLAQLALFIARSSSELLRGWILLHVGTRVGISIIADFLNKLMRLPLAFFDTHPLGDIFQRIQDHRRVENFLTSQALDALFSSFNLVVFSIVLCLYSPLIFGLFLAGSLLSISWVFLFLKRRRCLDHLLFEQLAQNQSSMVQLIQGVAEIKYNRAGPRMRWEWEKLQAVLFRTHLRGLAVEQAQSAGSRLINELKNILITFVAAKLVIEGQMSLGMMMAISFINGQLNGPVAQLTQFVKMIQDAKLSLDRLGETQSRRDEEPEGEPRIREVPEQAELEVENLSFHYEGPHSPKVLEDLSFRIPWQKTTAIVGASGSGKTTLLKLLLKSYRADSGRILLGKRNLDDYHADAWRGQCGVVLQDGYLFDDTIAHNIALGEQDPDQERLAFACGISNILSFIESLPLGFQTRVGANGQGLSQGQKQRLLIARAVYKDPPYLFFDEATSALDADNERTLIERLHHFLLKRTTIIVAHRLSTVRHADQILVLERGRLVERGTHEELTQLRGRYWNLVRNQLELGS